MVDFNQKGQNQSKKSIYFDIFDWNRPFSIYFWSLSINFELVDWNRTCFHRFCCNDWFGFQEFRSKKLIKWQFISDSKRNINPSRFNCLSLMIWEVRRPCGLEIIRGTIELFNFLVGLTYACIFFLTILQYI